MSDRFDEKVLEEQRKKKAFYVFKTMISVARLAGFRVDDPIQVRDYNGKTYNSRDYLTDV